MAVAALLIALLLLAAGLLLVDRGLDDDSRVTAGTSTSAAPFSLPTFETTTTVVTPSSIEPVGSTTAPPTSQAVGVIETSVGTLTIPRVNANTGPQSARLTLRNNGSAALSYTTGSSSKALSATPNEGGIAAGDRAELTVTLDASSVDREGSFSEKLSIGGTGGTKDVQVVSTVGRPPQLTEGRIVDTLSQADPCNTQWFYLVEITDSSPIKSARVIARIGRANGDTDLGPAGQPNGASGNYQSAQFDPLPGGSSLRFAIEAFDQHGFGTRSPEQIVNC